LIGAAGFYFPFIVNDIGELGEELLAVEDELSFEVKLIIVIPVSPLKVGS
jgi:hypothetical protein